MNKLFGIIGFGIVTGAVAYVLLSKKKKAESNSDIRTDDTPGKSGASNSSDIKNSQSKTIHNESIDFENTKASSVGTMYTRHKEASDIIRESVGNIFTNSEAFEKDDSDLDRLSNELEKLLDEENGEDR